MDKKQAQFILHSFRPDGADAMDADFADALQLAVEDRELGEWLADERATDAAFATALCEVKIPDELRMHILSVMRGEKPTDPDQEAEMDAMLSDAMTTVVPPDGLRDQILAAMLVQKNQPSEESAETIPENVSEWPSPATAPISEDRVPPGSGQWGSAWLRMSSLAAAIALGVFLAFQMDLGSSTRPSPSADNTRSMVRISSHDVQQVAGRMLNTKFALDVKNTPKTEVNTWLVNHELPAPTQLPTGLKGMKIMGCKKIQLSGEISASLLCFTKDSGGMVHLIVIKNEYINDPNLPSMDEMKKRDCYHCPKTGWNVVRWRDRENTFVLLAKKETATKDDLIHYF